MVANYQKSVKTPNQIIELWLYIVILSVPLNYEYIS